MPTAGLEVLTWEGVFATADSSRNRWQGPLAREPLAREPLARTAWFYYVGGGVLVGIDDNRYYCSTSGQPLYACPLVFGTKRLGILVFFVSGKRV